MAGKKKTNPNGSNQYSFDPRQIMTLEYYLNPSSETFSNGYKSALKAGYTEATALQVTAEKWFVDKYKEFDLRGGLVGKAEKVLKESLESNDKRLAQDTAKFVTSRLGKNLGYSERTEHTGADGKELPTPILANAIQLNIGNSKNSEPKQ